MGGRRQQQWPCSGWTGVREMIGKNLFSCFTFLDLDRQGVFLHQVIQLLINALRVS